MEFENILYQVEDGILYLTLNRPDVRNALSPGMWRDIQAGVQRAGSDPEVKVGIMPGAGGTQRLARLVGLGKAKELIFTGRIISAEEAAAIGLVNHVTEDNEEALMDCARDLAAQIMKKGPVATSLAKLCINLGYETDMNTGLMIERLAQTVAFSTQDRKEGTAAFLEKRAAQFQGK